MPPDETVAAAECPEEMWRRYEFIVNTSKDFMTLINADYVYEAVNKSYCHAHSKRPEDIVGRKASEVWGEERFVRHVKPPLDECFRGKEVQYRSWFQFSTLGVRYMDVTYYPYYSAEGQVTHAVVVSRDMTTYKLTEDQTHRQLRRLTALHDIAITNQLDIHLITEVLLQQVTEQLLMDAARVLLPDTTDSLKHVSSSGFHNPGNAPQTVQLPLHLTQQMVERQSIVYLPDALSEIPVSDLPSFWVNEGFSAFFGVPLVAGGQLRGVLELYHRQPMSPDQEWASFLETLAGEVAIAIDNAKLFESVRQANVDLVAAYDTTLEGWVRTLDLRDEETEGHTQRVTVVTLKLAKAMGIADPAQIEDIRRGTLLHDIGKMAIPDSVLLKPGPLTKEEWQVMRKHPQYAYDLLSPIAFLQPALQIPYNHHERWDGSGYPRGLAGEKIPLPARMFSVVDAWDALSSNRPYRAAWPQDRVLAYLEEQAGVLFDPNVVRTFLAMIKDGEENNAVVVPYAPIAP